MENKQIIKVIDSMSICFLGIIVLSLGLNIIMSWGLTQRSFVWSWVFVFLLAITLTLKNSIKENPEQSRKYILEWGIVVILGLTTSVLLLSFLR
ncbi:MAG: hypothetical protein ACTSUV_01455 [Candidatus Ranarchaeia archaeon]